MVNDRDRERADGVVGEITGGGGSALSSVFDVTDYAAVAAAVDAFGGADIPVNNAGKAGAHGFGGLTPFVETEPAQWGPEIGRASGGERGCQHRNIAGAAVHDKKK